MHNISSRGGTGGEVTDIVDSDLAKTSSDLQHSASAVLPSTQHHSDDAAHCIQQTGGLNCLPPNGCQYFFSLANTPAGLSNQLKALSTGQKYQVAKVYRFKTIRLHSCVSEVNALSLTISRIKDVFTIY